MNKRPVISFENQNQKPCANCGGQLFWRPPYEDGVRSVFRAKFPGRRHWVCGRCLPIDGLPRDWPDRHPGVPISATERSSTNFIPVKYRKENP